MDDATLLQLATQHGTPIYVYDLDTVATRARELKQALPTTKLYYAAKVNSHPRILEALREAGIGVETVSPGEIQRALEAGYRGDQLIYSCSNVGAAELVEVARLGVMANLDSLHQVELWGKLRLGERISLRVNLGIGGGHHEHVITGGPQSKFGIWHDDLEQARRLAEQYHLKIVGLHQHIGSNVLNAQLFAKASDALFALACDYRNLEFVNIGGGFGIPYEPGQPMLDLNDLGRLITTKVEQLSRELGRPIELRVENGRYFVAEAGQLLVEVMDIKRTPEQLFVGVNSGFNHLIRPAFYGSYHPVRNLSHPNQAPIQATIVGNVCETGDVFAHDREIAQPVIGDILSIGLAGAYGYSMSSDYNSRPKPKEIFVD